MNAMKSLSIIKREHRNLKALLYTLESLVTEIEKHGKAVDFVVFHGIVYYLDSFLDRYHHPKETDYLFPAVRLRCPAAGAVLDELGRQHAEGERLLGRMSRTLSAYEFLGEPGFPSFRDTVYEYVSFERHHAITEEKEVLPLAEARLLEPDWLRIDAAFADNRDPLFGEDTGGRGEAQ